ncbi:alpha-ketoglutarate decarboxylase [Winogradskyella arenosi]|uniref:Alpha-ketoglutarate decarboxylase n=1 Tax=Winogradskyella arenosi TaxID=533325 RepID=A0A368ZK60_9FLAO|nr:alpha-ketoglutarate decarboxylase [Winogradskyella arenosi]RCW93295.1 hypothetical protein DFQ08_10187 [Winogradskyella arenosi]
MKPHFTFKILIASLLYFLFTNLSFAQNSKSYPSDFWSHMEYGGGIGLNFSDGYFSAFVAPNALYRFNPYVATGIGLNYSYSSQKDIYKSTVLGGSLIALVNPIKEIQLSAEFEQLHVSRNYDNRYVGNADEDYWYPALFLGAGYSSGNVTIGIRYDVLYDKDKSIYTEAWMPFVRFRF